MLCLANKRFLKDVLGETLVFDFTLELKINNYVLAVGLEINIGFGVDFGSILGVKLAPKSMKNEVQEQLENKSEKSSGKSHASVRGPGSMEGGGSL